MTTPWDESTRPTVAPVDAAAEPRRVAAGQHLLDVHDHYRRELAQLRDVLRQVRDGAMDAGVARSAVNDMALRANTWVLGSVCQSYCFALTQHHTMEDTAIFPHLEAREGALRAVLDRLGEEHVAIHHLLEAVDAALVDLVRDPDDLDAVEQAVEVLTSALLSHFAYEERQLVGPLSRHGFYPGQL